MEGTGLVLISLDEPARGRGRGSGERQKEEGMLRKADMAAGLEEIVGITMIIIMVGVGQEVDNISWE